MRKNFRQLAVAAGVADEEAAELVAQLAAANAKEAIAMRQEQMQMLPGGSRRGGDMAGLLGVRGLSAGSGGVAGAGPGGVKGSSARGPLPQDRGVNVAGLFGLLPAAKNVGNLRDITFVSKRSGG